MKVALLGATGAIGRTIADALEMAGEEYRVVGRDRAPLDRLYGRSLLSEVVTWNPDSPESIRQAVRGAEALIYLVGVPYDRFDLHPVLMKRTLEAAEAEGVKKMLLIGTVYPYGRPQTARVTEAHHRDPHTFKGKMRKAQEDLLLQAHAEGRLEGTVLRLPDFYGPGVSSSFLHSLFQAASRGGTADLIGPINMPHEYVFVPDVGPVALALLNKNEAYGRWWNLAGAGSITQQQIAAQVAALSTKQFRKRVVGKNMLRLLGLFNPFLRELVEMHYLLTTPVLMDDTALHGLLGEIKKTSYADGIRQTLESYCAADAEKS